MLPRTLCQAKFILASTALGVLAVFGASCRPAPPPAEQSKPSPSPALWNLSGKPPHVVAHYMPWFEIQKSATDPTVTWQHWKWDGPRVKHNPENQLSPGRHDIASVFYPLIGLYNSWDPAVMRYHLQTARAAGIQAFIVIWYGPGSPTDACIPALLEEAAKADMRIALCYEEKINFPPYRDLQDRDEIVNTARTDLQYLLDRYGGHPAYLKRKGKPFIAQFNGWGVGPLGPKYLVSSELRKILGSLKPVPAYCRQNLDEPYHPAAEGCYIWWTPDMPARKQFSERARKLVAEGKLEFFMAMACPGFDDSGVDGWDQEPRITPREGLKVFQETFAEAWDAHPELIQLVTWNDFNEGTVIEPTVEDGFAYLDALEAWLGKKTGRQIDLKDNPSPLDAYKKQAGR